MAESELEKAFQTLNTALNVSESESTEEIKIIEEQINELTPPCAVSTMRQEP